MRTSSKEFRSGTEAGAFPIWDCGSPLYDSHELVSIVHTIERHMVVWPYLGGPKPIITQLHDPEEVSSIKTVSKGSSTVTSSRGFSKKSMWQRKLTRERITKKHKKVKARFSGFYDGLVCGANRLLSLS